MLSSATLTPATAGRNPFNATLILHTHLEDLIGDATYDREGSDLQSRGLFLDAPPWQASAFCMTKREQIATGFSQAAENKEAIWS